MQEQNTEQSWWQVVAFLANKVANGANENDLGESVTQQELLAAGFDDGDVQEALAWVEKARTSGTLLEALAMCLPISRGMRVSHPLEKACFSENLWQRFESCRSRGLIGGDVYEKLLESVRCLDTRDLDDHELSCLLSEMYAVVMPHVGVQEFNKLLSGRFPLYYS